MNVRIISSCVVSALCLAAQAREKKVVSFAWEWARTGPSELLEIQPQIAACGLDGIGVYVWFDQDGKRMTSKGICDAAWKYEAMRPEAEKFRKVIGRPGLTDCFLVSFRVPGHRFDWRDDASWATVRENMRLCARFAKESGCVGLCIDHEDYPKQRQFDRLPNDPPMAELEGLVRRRGREIFEAVYEEFPEAKLFFFWFMTEHARSLNGAADPLQAVRDANLLWAFFANGILDAMPPTGRIYDGNECSYEYKSEYQEYLIQANATRQMDGFAYPENRTKYRAQVSPSSAIYLDMYCQTNSAKQWYRPPFAGSRLGMFRRDLKQALDSSDEYVWTWSEKSPYVKRAKRSGGDWERLEEPVWWNLTLDEEMPGFNRAMIAIKNPMRFIDEIYPAMMRDSGKHKSLVPPDFSPESQWQEKRKNREPGRFENDEAVFGAAAPSVRIAGVAKGCVSAGVEGVQAGEIYAVRLKAKVQSGGFFSHVGWQREGKWRFFEPVKALSFGKPDERGWRTGATVVTTPENVDRLVLLFGVCQEPGDACWVDDVEIVRVD